MHFSSIGKDKINLWDLTIGKKLQELPYPPELAKGFKVGVALFLSHFICRSVLFASQILVVVAIILFLWLPIIRFKGIQSHNVI